MIIFADSDYFIGFYFLRDAHHQTCVRLSQQLEDVDIVISWDVIDETATKLRYYINKQISLNFILDTIQKKFIIIYPNQSLFLQAKKIFEDEPHKHVSLTDCMNMAIMKEKGIKKVLSFDKIYEQNGFELIK